MMTMMIRQFGP